MAAIQVTLNREDAEDLLPLIEAQMHSQGGTATGALWRGLHAAIVAALQGLG